MSSHIACDRWRKRADPVNPRMNDGSAEVVALFPDAQGQQGVIGRRTQGSVFGAVNAGQAGGQPREESEASAARFFYCAKARADRNAGLIDPGFQFKHGSTLRDVENAERTGNTHPTVKPTDLMAYLIRLVTPPGGIVLDPFMGSGSTGKAAVREGCRFVGIDLSVEYFPIAAARVQHEVELVEAIASAPPAPQLNLFAEVKP